MDEYERFGSKETEESMNPYMCGYCKAEFKLFEQFYLHLKLHNVSINRQFHICDSIWDTENEDVYTCMLCHCNFGTICQLHDHLLHCFDDGSYLQTVEDGQKKLSYFYHNKQKCLAYPLASFCAFVDSRKIYSDNRINTSSLPLPKWNENGFDFFEILEDFFISYTDSMGQMNENSDSKRLVNQSKVYKDATTSTNDLEKVATGNNDLASSVNLDKEEIVKKTKSRQHRGTQKPKHIKTRLKSVNIEKNKTKRQHVNKRKKSLTDNSESKIARDFSNTACINGVKKMQCDLCGMRFAHKENLTQHISGIHKRERRFSCQDCNKTFFTNYQLKCHSMKHSGLRPHKCTMCKSDFIERKELRRHMKKQHDMSLEGIPTGQYDEEKSDRSVSTLSAFPEKDAVFQTQSHSTYENVSIPPETVPSIIGSSQKEQETGATTQNMVERQVENMYGGNEIAKHPNNENCTLSSNISKVPLINDPKSSIHNNAGVVFPQTIGRFYSPTISEMNNSNYRLPLQYNEDPKHFASRLANECLNTDPNNSAAKPPVFCDKITLLQKDDIDKSIDSAPSPDPSKNFLSL